jgi:hypothetical protein
MIPRCDFVTSSVLTFLLLHFLMPRCLLVHVLFQGDLSGIITNATQAIKSIPAN